MKILRYTIVVLIGLFFVNQANAEKRFGVPTPSYPIGQISENNPFFVWTHDEENIGYNLELTYDVQAVFDDIVTPACNTHCVTGFDALGITPLEWGASYQWRVLYQTAAGWQTYSSQQTFTTPAPTATPTPLPTLCPRPECYTPTPTIQPTATLTPTITPTVECGQDNCDPTPTIQATSTLTPTITPTIECDNDSCTPTAVILQSVSLPSGKTVNVIGEVTAGDLLILFAFAGLGAVTVFEVLRRMSHMLAKRG